MSDLPDLSAGELVALVARGEASCVEVVGAHLDRIDALNPRVNAIVGLRDRADVLAEAAARDRSPHDGAERGPLHGLPIAVKDLSEVAGLPWTLGSPIFRDQVGAVDEPFVARLRAAGAVVVGKTNTPELGFGSQTFNPVHGATRNPYDLGRTIGGSSGGRGRGARGPHAADRRRQRLHGLAAQPGGVRQRAGLPPDRGHGRAARADRAARRAGADGAHGRRRRPAARRDGRAATGRRSTAPWRAPGSRGSATSADGWRPSPACWSWAGAPPTRSPGWAASSRSTCPRSTSTSCGTRSWCGAACTRWSSRRCTPTRPCAPSSSRRSSGRSSAGWRFTALDVSRAAAVRQRWVEAVGALFERFDAVLAPSTQVFPFDVATPWPEVVDGRRMDTYHRWMETVMPWSMAGTPVLGMPAGLRPARPADRGAARRPGGRGPRGAAPRPGVRGGDAVGGPTPAGDRQLTATGGLRRVVRVAGQHGEPDDRQDQAREAHRATRDAQPQVLAEEDDPDRARRRSGRRSCTWPAARPARRRGRRPGSSACR